MSIKDEQKAMDAALEAMLNRAKANPEHAKPIPLVEAALKVSADPALSYGEKYQQVSALQKQAAPHEQPLFADVWEGLIVSSDLDERLAYEDNN